MKFSIFRNLKKAAAVVSAMMLLGASAAEMPAMQALKPENMVTASAYSKYYGKQIDTSRRYFKWPLPKGNSKVTGAFDDGRKHGAIDVSAVKGTNVYASADGYVVYSKNYNNKGYGRYVVLRHTINGVTYYTQYSHLSEALAKEDAKVKQGELIGKTGDTDAQGSYHLDFQIRRVESVLGPDDRMARNIDPLKVLDFPSTLENGADANPEHVGNYLQDRTTKDRCPDQLKNGTPGRLYETLQCEKSKHHKLGSNAGSAWLAIVKNGRGYMQYGPYHKYSTGKKLVSFRLKTDFNTDRVWTDLHYYEDNIVCRIEVSDHTDKQRTLASMDIRRSDFLKSQTYQDFELTFQNRYADHELEYRIYYYGCAAIWADRIQVRTL